MVEISLNGEPEVSSEGSRALLLDGCLQALPLAAGKDDLFLPFGWNRLWLTDVLPERFWCRAEITDASDELLKADLTLLVGDGTILGAIEGFTAKRATRQRLLAAGGGIGSLLYEVSWRPSSDTPTSESARERRELQERQGNWVLVGDGGGVSGEIAAALGVCYQKTIQVDTSRDRPTEKSATVVASRREDWRAFFAKLGDELRGVLHLSGIDAGASAADTEGVARDVRTAMTSALALSQGLDDARRAPSGGLWILTRGRKRAPREPVGIRRVLSSGDSHERLGGKQIGSDLGSLILTPPNPASRTTSSMNCCVPEAKPSSPGATGCERCHGWYRYLPGDTPKRLG